MTELQAAIFAALRADQWTSIGEVAQKAGVNLSSTRDALRRMQKAGLVQKVSGMDRRAKWRRA